MPKKPKVLLISPTCLDKSGKPIVQNKTYLPALTLAQLAALTPDTVDVTIISETSENIPRDEHWDLVGLSGMGGSGVVRGYQLAKEFRERGSKVVMGGIAVSLFDPEVTLEHVDTLVKGEAEDLWPQVIDDFINGRLKDFYKMKSPPDITKFPIPAYHKMNMKNYGFWRPVQATRGCPFPCSFCSISEFFSRGYRKRPIDQVVRDVRAAKASGSRYIAFIDDNIGVDFKYCKALWEALIPENIIWVSQCSLHISENEDMLDLAYRSGCRILSFGVETINKDSLTHIDKEWNRPERYQEAFKTIRKHGIEISSEMILGMDGDDESVFEKTFDFIMESRIALPRLYILTPVPGTPMHREMKEDGRIFNTDITNYQGGAAVFHPKNMSAETLEKGYWNTYRELYKLSNVYKRIKSNPADLNARMRLFVMGTNMVYRNHISREITPGIV
ncbi:MAG: B12-binding domain-containing radical SAM protein [Lewinellaceae bacterium]|nr:B12-binding domain-containing radical SAM protein [Lewinellaceae bacterium]